MTVLALLLSFALIALLGYGAINRIESKKFNRYIEELLSWAMAMKSDEPNSQAKPWRPPPPTPELNPWSVADWSPMLYRVQKTATLLQQIQSEQSKEFARFINAIQASPNGVLLLSTERTIQWCNAESAKHLHIDATRDLGQHINFLVRQPHFLHALNHPEHSNPDIPLVLSPHPDSPERHIQVNIITYGEGQRLIISRDASLTHRLETMRREFVANVSHELKTPVAVLSIALENLRDLPLAEEERQSMLTQMHTQITRMNRLINDFLMLASLESTPPPPEKQPISMSAIFTDLKQSAQVLSGGMHRFNWQEIDEHLGLYGSANEIASAFGNVLSNAIRYSPEGGLITIRWQRTPPAKLSSKIGEGEHLGGFFSISDEGIGIATELHERITERFYRVDKSRSLATGGTGLGLSIVKHVLLRHDGRLFIDSMPQSGSVFHLVFPPHRVFNAQ